MLARWIGTSIITASLAPATIASAQSDVPDLKGTWSSTTSVVLRSQASEHIDPTGGETTFTTLLFTITIERQDGHRFAGSWTSARASDPLIGVIRSDGKRLHMVDNDGTLTGELVGPDEMEVCRTEVTPESMAVICGVFLRGP